MIFLPLINRDLILILSKAYIHMCFYLCLIIDCRPTHILGYQNSHETQSIGPYMQIWPQGVADPATLGVEDQNRILMTQLSPTQM